MGGGVVGGAGGDTEEVLFCHCGLRTMYWNAGFLHRHIYRNRCRGISTLMVCVLRKGAQRNFIV